MKQQAIQYLFIDVHQATCVATVRDQAGGIVMRATVAKPQRSSGNNADDPGYEPGNEGCALHVGKKWIGWHRDLAR